MKTSTLRIAFATLLLAAMALLPAFAQQPTATLTFNGTVMTSSGGEFVAASSGQQVAYGTRVMVSEGSTATLTYPDGAVVNLTQPGVYTVSAAGSRLVRTRGNTAAAKSMAPNTTMCGGGAKDCTKTVTSSIRRCPCGP